MYAAKDAHAGAELYDPARDEYDPERLALIGELRRAIEHDELFLHYQPKVDAAGTAWESRPWCAGSIPSAG